MRQVRTIPELQEAVRDEPFVRVAAGGTKPALTAGANVSVADMTGILEYEPGEFTFTAKAATPVREVQTALDEHGQYLPFDPLLADAGATLGGTVAAGLSGPGRFRFGGVRDFLLGVRLVTGIGRIVYAGGKVVKNAAGFDVPKLMVGSLGRFGVLAEVTFKVFPCRQDSHTLVVELEQPSAALDLMAELAASGQDIDCLDLVPPATLWIRLRGMADALPQRVEKLCARLPAGCRVEHVADDEPVWHSVREFAWVSAAHAVVKVAIAPTDIPSLEEGLAVIEATIERRYSVAGNVVWLVWPHDVGRAALDELLQGLGRPGLAITGDWPDVVLGPGGGAIFAERLRQVFDPQGKFARELRA